MWFFVGLAVLAGACRGVLGIEEANVSCAITPTLTNTVALTRGIEYSPDFATGRVAKRNGEIYVSESTVDTLRDEDFVAVFTPPPPPYVGFSYPRLVPGGNELLMVARLPDFSELLVRSVRLAAGSWTPPEPVAVQDEAGVPIASFILGGIASPTTTTPRMITGSFDMTEFEARPDGSWRRFTTYNGGDLGVAFVSRPNLTADGLAVAFNVSNQAFLSTRPNVLAAFGRASLVDNSVQAGIPVAVSPDCTQWFFADGGQIYLVTP